MEVAALFFMIVAMLLIGTPIAVALGLSSITFLLVLSDTSLYSTAYCTLYSTLYSGLNTVWVFWVSSHSLGYN